MTILQNTTSVLIVDDEALVRRTLRKCLAGEGFNCEEAGSVDEAFEHLKNKLSEVVILDIKMPGKLGSQALPEIKRDFPDTAVVMATAVIDPCIIAQCMKDGAEDYITKPFDVDHIVENIKIVLEKRRLQLEINRARTVLEGKAIEQTRMLQKTFSGAIESLISALEAKDQYTAGHSRRVTEIAVAIGRNLKLSEEMLEDLRWGSLLHDIGKIGIDAKIQNKPGKLTPEEYQCILGHCSIGPGIVQSLVNERIVEIIRHHHDWYDGSRTSQTIRKENIPLGARIVAVADSFDAMTSDRPYRAAISTNTAIAEITQCIAKQFDPIVVKAFLEIN